jgi:tetratricopeptide (TPR) repeat protein
MDLRDKYALLIDDLPDMRNAMRIQLGAAGIARCDSARNVSEAIDRISSNTYDIIVCDYNLGQGADGQQLLELVRRKEILPPSTAFLMVTGENTYEQVATAAEFAPDDYLIKPFTADTLGVRLSRIIDKKNALKPLYKHLGPRGDKHKALAACDPLMHAQPRYVPEIQRVKGELLLALERPQEAFDLYEKVLTERSTPWAEVGHARALAALGKADQAKAQLERALDAYPNYLAAFDTLAGMLAAEDTAAAQVLVERALKVAPSTRRQRELGALALGNGDFERAEAAYRRAVEKDRSGFFKSHDDYAGLAKSCSALGKPKEALEAVKQMGLSFAPSNELKARQAALESQVQAKAGNTAASKAALERALAVGGHLPPAAALDVASACFANGEVDKARDIIRQVAEDHDENANVLAAAQSVFAAAGLADEGAEFLATTRSNMIKLNNEAVALARSGELERAIEMLESAADRLLNNAQVSINAALALLMSIQRGGPNPDRLSAAERYLKQAQSANPRHPRLAAVLDMYRNLSAPDNPEASA